MKKLVFLMFLMSLTFSAFAQPKSYEELKKETERYQQYTTTLYIQLKATEQLSGGNVKINLIIGNNKQFFIKDKYDYDEVQSIQDGILGLVTIPDALDFLGERGYNINEYSTVMGKDMIQHNIILSKVSFQ